MAYSWLSSVAADRFDDEFVVAQLSTGLYYSIRGGIVELLDAMPFGNPEVALDAWQARLGAEAEERAQVEAVWNDLLAEGLIADRPDVKGTEGGESGLVLATRIPSEMARYGDMQDLLALDIIHDVDEQGWPEEGEIAPESDQEPDAE
jgi:hypothetical protein